MNNLLKKIEKINFQIKDISKRLKSWEDVGSAEDDIEIDIHLIINNEKVKTINTFLDVYQLIDLLHKLITNSKKKELNKIETCYFMDLFINASWYNDEVLIIDFEDIYKGLISFNIFKNSVKELMNDLILKVNERDSMDIKNRRDAFLNYWESLQI